MIALRRTRAALAIVARVAGRGRRRRRPGGTRAPARARGPARAPRRLAPRRRSCRRVSIALLRWVALLGAGWLLASTPPLPRRPRPAGCRRPCGRCGGRRCRRCAARSTPRARSSVATSVVLAPAAAGAAAAARGDTTSVSVVRDGARPAGPGTPAASPSSHPTRRVPAARARTRARDPAPPAARPRSVAGPRPRPAGRGRGRRRRQPLGAGGAPAREHRPARCRGPTSATPRSRRTGPRVCDVNRDHARVGRPEPRVPGRAGACCPTG